MTDPAEDPGPVIPVWAAVISPDCQCRWDQVPDDVGYELAAVNPGCVLHGPGQPFDASRRELGWPAPQPLDQ